MELSNTDYEHTNYNAPKEQSRKDELFVGSGLKLKLEVSTCDTFRLEGEAEGKVKAIQMLMSETGNFSGDVEVENATVDGSFDGSLTVSGLLRVGKTGRINGKLRYKEIEIERNGQVRGDIDTVESDLKLVEKLRVVAMSDNQNSETTADHHRPEHNLTAIETPKTEAKPQKRFF